MRNLKQKNSSIPNFKAKLWALRLQDELTKKDPLRLPEGEQERQQLECSLPPKQVENNLVIVGTDVEALFPSLQDVESARIAREAVLISNTSFENFNYETALKYLYIVGGPTHLREIGLAKIAPRWTGPRPDLLSVEGDSCQEENKWWFPRRVFSEEEKKQIVARVVEAAVIICMGTHVYTFCGDIFLQKEGGPIGMRFTASLANIVMKMWDISFKKLLEREGLDFKL